MLLVEHVCRRYFLNGLSSLYLFLLCIISTFAHNLLSIKYCIGNGSYQQLCYSSVFTLNYHLLLYMYIHSYGIFAMIRAQAV